MIRGGKILCSLFSKLHIFSANQHFISGWQHIYNTYIHHLYINTCLICFTQVEVKVRKRQCGPANIKLLKNILLRKYFIT